MLDIIQKASSAKSQVPSALHVHGLDHVISAMFLEAVPFIASYQPWELLTACEWPLRDQVAALPMRGNLT